jgi:C1A family cysteine protease
MKGKIISILIIILMIVGSTAVTGLNNNASKENIKVSENGTKINEIIDEFESNSCNCENVGYYLGLIGDPFTLYKPEKLVELSGDPPESWDWRDATYNGTTGNWVTSVKDQGQCGSCATFASTACFESAYKISKSDPNMDVDFSEQYQVSCGKEWIGFKSFAVRMNGCMGATTYAVLEFTKKYGAINETCFPYISGIDGYEPPCTDKCENWEEQRIWAADYKLVMGEFIEENDEFVEYNITNYKNALIQFGPLASPMFVYEDFPDYTGGIYELNRSKSLERLGGHMVLIVGYKDDPSIDSGGYWICKNSWGPEWGENGYFRIKYDDWTEWFYKEYDNRIKNIKNFRDYIEFYIWIEMIVFEPPCVGIGYVPSAFFTGVTAKKTETNSQTEIFSEGIPSLRFFERLPIPNFKKMLLNLI